MRMTAELERIEQVKPRLNLNDINGEDTSLNELIALLDEIEKTSVKGNRRTRQAKQTIADEKITAIKSYLSNQMRLNNVQENLPRNWTPYYYLAGIAGLTIVLVTAILSSNSPNAQLTTQQQILGSMGIEAIKSRPNISINCGFFSSGCDKVVDRAIETYGDNSTSIQGENVNLRTQYNQGR